MPKIKWVSLFNVSSNIAGTMPNSVATWVNLFFQKMGRSPKIFVKK